MRLALPLLLVSCAAARSPAPARPAPAALTPEEAYALRRAGIWDFERDPSVLYTLVQRAD